MPDDSSSVKRPATPHQLANELADDETVEVDDRAIAGLDERAVTGRLPEAGPQRVASQRVDDATIEVDDRAVAALNARAVTGRLPQTAPPPKSRHEGLNQGQRNIGRMMALVLCGVAVIGLVISAIVFQQWLLLGLGMVFAIPFGLLLMAPFWLASGTKMAQDDAVRRQRGHSGART